MKLKLGLIQAKVRLGDVSYNFSHIEHLLEEAAASGADVLVLPEMWNTGFYPKENLTELADENGERAKTLLSRMAKKYNIYIVGGSVAVKEGDVLYNRAYVMDGNGNLMPSYDKVHGFSPSGEPEVFAMGKDIPFFKIQTLTASMVICYDIRFPELIRREALGGADIIFAPAAWPKVRTYHWDTLLRARAIENQIFLCGVNQGGHDGSTEYAGHSLLLDPWGESLCQLGTEEDIQIAAIDTGVLDNVRSRMRIFRDRREDMDVILPKK